MAFELTFSTVKPLPPGGTLVVMGVVSIALTPALMNTVGNQKGMKMPARVRKNASQKSLPNLFLNLLEVNPAWYNGCWDVEWPNSS